MAGPQATSLSWDDDPGRTQWSAELLNLVAGSITDLERGNPEDFVSGYSTLSQQLRKKFWAELLIAMAKFESSWNPKEPFLEHDGQWSIGLLQLSIGDQNNYHLEPRVEHEEELQDPFINLRWGVQIFTHLLVRDGVVALGSNGNDARGGARYWSVLRVGHKVDQIKALTKKNLGLT
jgi:hypothetical protein